MRMDADDSALLIIDVQHRLLNAMDAPTQVVGNCRLLMQAADILKVPITVSEQYPEGLGPTVEEVGELAPQDAFYSKVEFSCADNTLIRGRIEASGKKQAVLAGIESHVCVLQSALGFRDAGMEVFVAGDATSSRRPASQAAALARLRDAGVHIVTAEMVVFEWLKKAGSPEFKELSKMLR